MLDDLPEDLPAPVLRAELVEHLQLDQAVGKARSAESMSVEQRNAILEKAKPVFSRMTDLIDAHYPAGKPGRSSFFPTDITDPTMGDLLISYGRGVQERGKPRLPDGWTPQSLIELGGDVNRALETPKATPRIWCASGGDRDRRHGPVSPSMSSKYTTPSLLGYSPGSTGMLLRRTYATSVTWLS
jgi:hypothetical protein